MTVLLDTTVLIDVLRGRRDRSDVLIRILEQGHTLTIAAINLAEVYAGMRPEEEPAPLPS